MPEISEQRRRGRERVGCLHGTQLLVVALTRPVVNKSNIPVIARLVVRFERAGDEIR